MKIQLTVAQIGFIKAIGVVVITSVVSFFADSANLTGVLNPMLSTFVAAAAASYESYLKERTGDGLFGAVSVK